MFELLDWQALTILGGFAIIANRLTKAIFEPIFDKYLLDKFWLMYVAWIVAGVLVWASGANVFAYVMPSPLVGQILTAVAAGGGANLFHDLTEKQPSLVINKNYDDEIEYDLDQRLG
jgi:hypothetical protein